jgi:hypothetical protein
MSDSIHERIVLALTNTPASLPISDDQRHRMHVALGLAEVRSSDRVDAHDRARALILGAPTEEISERTRQQFVEVLTGSRALPDGTHARLVAAVAR